ncbi:MAG: hypothetical protein ACMXYG_07090 [Candidatus Woesearchaeota archaeon]
MKILKQKSGLMSELIGIFIFVIVFSAAALSIAGIVNWILNSNNPDETATIESFNNFADSIEQLLEQEGAYVYADDVLLFLDSKFLLVAFDEDDSKIEMWSDRFFSINPSNSAYSTEIIIPKPNNLDCMENCLCLYRHDKTNNWGSFDINKPPLVCRAFPNNVFFYTYSNFPRDLNLILYGFHSSQFRSLSFRRNNFDYVKDIIELLPYYGNDFLVSYDAFYFYISGSPVDNNARNFKFFQQMYIEIVNSSLIIDNEDRIFVHIIPNYKSDDFVLGFIQDRYLNPRVDILSQLSHRSYHDYSNKILSSNRDSDKLMFFMDYYVWAHNKLLFDESLHEHNIKLLGVETLIDVQQAIERRLEKCDSSLTFNLIEECKEYYVDFCSSIDVSNPELCVRYLRLNLPILPSELNSKLLELIKELDPSGELDRQIFRARDHERNNRYFSAYSLYNDILLEYFTEESGEIDLIKVKENPRLLDIFPALELRQLYKNDDLDLSYYSSDTIYVYEIYNSKSSFSSLIIENEDVIIIDSNKRLSDHSSYEEILNLEKTNFVHLTDLNTGILDKNKIYYSFELLEILIGKSCLQQFDDVSIFIVGLLHNDSCQLDKIELGVDIETS